MATEFLGLVWGFFFSLKHLHFAFSLQSDVVLVITFVSYSRFGKAE